MVVRRSQALGGSSEPSSDEPSGIAGSDETSENESIDPASVIDFFGETADEYARDKNGAILYTKSGKPRKKRGPNKGTKSGSKSDAGNSPLVSGIETLATSLMVVHAGIASFTKFEEFALSDTEATTLSKSVVNVMQEFDIAPDPRIVAVFGLVTTAGMIYGPRMYNYSEFRAAKKKAKEEEVITTQFHGPNLPEDNSMLFTAGLMRGSV